VATNLVSMTDGQIVLSMPLFTEGFRPAVDVGLSVSRVGSKVQWKATKAVSKSLRLEFIQFKEILRVSKLQTGGQSEEMKGKLDSGKILQSLLTQPPASPVPMEMQIMIFFAKNEKMLNEFEKKEQAEIFQKGLPEFTDKTDPTLRALIREKKEMTDEIKGRITAVCEAYVQIVLEETKEEDDVEEG